MSGNIRITAGTEVVTLSTPTQPRPMGLALITVPDGLSGFEVQHHLDESWGHPARWAGEHRAPVEMQLDLRTKGPDPRGQVNELLDILRYPVSVVVTSPELGDRWVTAWKRQVSNIMWHGGSAVNATFATFSVLLTIPDPVWVSEPEWVEKTTAPWGWIDLPTTGEQAFWPRITISGTHDGVAVRLTADDIPQSLPYDPRGWVVETEPSRPGISTVTGAHDYTGYVPFWATPVEPLSGLAQVEIIPTNPGADFRVRVEWTPRSDRAW